MYEFPLWLWVFVLVSNGFFAIKEKNAMHGFLAGYALKSILVIL